MPVFNPTGCARTERHKWENRASAEVLLNKPRARRLTKNVNDPAHMQKLGSNGGGGSKRHKAAAAAAAAAEEQEDLFSPAGDCVDWETAQAQAKEALRDADGDLSLITETERTADILLEGLAPAQVCIQNDEICIKSDEICI